MFDISFNMVHWMGTLEKIIASHNVVQNDSIVSVCICLGTVSTLGSSSRNHMSLKQAFSHRLRNLTVSTLKGASLRAETTGLSPECQHMNFC